MVLWVIDSRSTERIRLLDRYAPGFCVGGTPSELRQLEAWLKRSPLGAGHLCFAYDSYQDLWSGRWQTVGVVRVDRPTEFPRVVRQVQSWVAQGHHRVELYNADLVLAAQYCYEKGLFPLARCWFEWEREAAGSPVAYLRHCEVRDDPWATDYDLPPLRTMELRLSGETIDPRHGRRSERLAAYGGLEISVDGRTHMVSGQEETELLPTLRQWLRRYDPDILLTEWGDAVLLPRLLRGARAGGPATGTGEGLPLNREPEASVEHRSSRSYFSYGRIVFKDSTSTLFGRLHIDRKNSFIVGETELHGLFELARLSKLPLQYLARTSTGTAITSIELDRAIQEKILIPWQKREPEDFKTADLLLRTDRGGLVFKPVLGFHENVGELDFASMFPAIMACFNVSPETVNCRCCAETPVSDQLTVPEIGYRICQRRRGLVPAVVGPLIEKRARYKRLRDGTTDPSLRRRYDQCQTALKWMLVTCFGYLGYKNARFGRIEAHEAINAFGRDRLLAAKELAEAAGFRLLHAIVDSLWIEKPGATPAEYGQLATAVERATGLPVSFEGIYQFIVFLPSRQDARRSVPNRYFGVFAGPPGCAGSRQLKVRGLEVRRHDTPPLVARMQQEVLELLAEAQDARSYQQKLVEAARILARYQERLESGRVRWSELLIRKRLSQPPSAYRKASAVAIAAHSLAAHGIGLRPGEVVEYVITNTTASLPSERACAYGLLDGVEPYDREKYGELLRQAFEPFALYFRSPPGPRS